MSISINKNSDKISLIQQDCNVTGVVDFAGELQVVGHVQADITGEFLTIRSGGLVVGNVICSVCRIQGEVRGVVNAEKIIVSKGGFVNAEINYVSLAVESGGLISGQCNHVENFSSLFPDETESTNVSKLRKSA
jgi:cytoskeletal protein CcmA (bactofilin family)